MSTLIGRAVTQYKIHKHLGGGGMGVVYKAQNLKLDHPVTLKSLVSNCAAGLYPRRSQFDHGAGSMRATAEPT